MSQVSTVVSFGFIALVAILYSIVVIGVVYGRNRAGDASQTPVYVLRFCVGGFLLITGLLALQGTFAQIHSFPPRIAIATLIAFIGIGCFAASPRVGQWLVFSPQSWLIAIQVFRVFVEWILYALAKTPLIPIEMTFEGRNFDILIGLTAPMLAFYLHKNKNAPSKTRAPLLIWNSLGLMLLAQVLITGMVMQPPAIGIFPYVWLPSFMVPFGVLLHVLSLRKLKQTAQAAV
jgi:hypothetical protein